MNWPGWFSLIGSQESSYLLFTVTVFVQRHTNERKRAVLCDMCLVDLSLLFCSTELFHILSQNLLRRENLRSWCVCSLLYQSIIILVQQSQMVWRSVTRIDVESVTQYWKNNGLLFCRKTLFLLTYSEIRKRRCCSEWGWRLSICRKKLSGMPPIRAKFIACERDRNATVFIPKSSTRQSGHQSESATRVERAWRTNFASVQSLQLTTATRSVCPSVVGASHCSAPVV